MPSMSFVYDSGGGLLQNEPAVLQSLDSLIHTEVYQSEILLKEKTYLLASTRYKEYPVTSFESDDISIYLEGRIYGKDNSSLKGELTALSGHLFQPQTESSEHISEWLLNTDGDFIIFSLNKKLNRVAILNDALGRLPLYYHEANGQLIVSRELRFITKMLTDWQFDRMAIAQYLLFGYPLGRRNILENTCRLDPATLIRVDLNEAKIELDNIHQLNFEVKKYSDRTIQQNASELVALFSESCKKRASTDNKNVVSLSGGLDSRSVSGALHRNNIPFAATTYLDYGKTVYASDLKPSEQLANIFGIDRKLFQLAPPKGKDILRLLKIKNGLNPLGMGFILPYFDEVIKNHGQGITYFTGDGGDQILQYDHRPSPKPKGIDELVKHIISMKQVLPLDTVASLTGIKESQIIDEVTNHVMSYPEKDLSQKYVHFMTCEYGINWYWEGEDRNRCYFWSVAPFYSIQLFNYVMNCPDRQKSQYALYRQFLSELSPQAAAIDYAGPHILIPLPITSIRFRIMRSMVAILSRFPNLKRKVIGKVKPETTSSHAYNSNFLQCLKEQTVNCKAISDYLSLPAIEETLKDYSKYSIFQINNLFTVTSFIEDLKDGKSTIEAYYEAEFI